MTEASSERKLLSRAATMSYLMSIGILLYIPLVFLLAYSEPIHLMSGFSGSSITRSLMIAYPAGFIVTLILVLAAMFVNILFGYFNVLVGECYGVPTLRRAGKAGIFLSILSIAVIPVGIGQVGFVSFGTPTPSYMAISFLYIALILVMVVAYLEFFVMMYRGLGGMRERTHIEEFDTAKILWLVGFFVGLTMPIALIFYGNGLRKLMERKQAVVMEPRTRSGLRAEVNYCSHCGAKIEPGARFCSTCGAPIGYGNE